MAALRQHARRHAMQATVVETKRERTPLNGVDTPTLFATINAVKGMPELAKF
jgi:hypothetical protein